MEPTLNSLLPLALEVGSRPALIRLNGDQGAPKIVVPLNDCGFQEAILDLKILIKGNKKCLACLEGEWLLMFDEGTSECFMLSLASLSQISLPPLLKSREELHGCALSCTTPPDCTVMFAAWELETDDCYLLYCRPGDEEWQELQDDENCYPIDCSDIVGCQGIMYVPTDRYTFTAIDVSSRTTCSVQRRGIPHPSMMRWSCQERLVGSDGEVFLVQCYTHGLFDSEVIDLDVHRLDSTSSGHVCWNKVESIGDRTIFVGHNCVVLSSASKAGTQPDCVHLLLQCRDLNGIRMYTIRLDDRTMSCTLLPGSSTDILYWVVPSRFKEEEFNETVPNMSSKTNEKSKLIFGEDAEQVEAPWSSLVPEMVEELIPRISFIDYLNLRQVCKGWSSISKPIQFAERYPIYPMLMSICSSSTGVVKLFDPIVEREYILKNSSLAPCTDYFQMLLFAKQGWVLVMRGQMHIYAANPFTGERLHLPDLPWDGHNFDGISFSFTPKSLDCTVCCIFKDRIQGLTHHLYVMVWRTGDEHWTQKKLEDHTQFRTAYGNPVFYHGEFYCLGTRGNLGVFNPDSMTWRVLDKPEPVLEGDPMPGDRYCHLLEFRDDLIAIFRHHNDGPIDLYSLNKCQMVWTKVEKLDAEVIFVDNWNAVMKPAPRGACANRIYMTRQIESGEGGGKSKFYDIKSRKYYPDYYGLTEPMNSIWVEPKLKHK